MSEVRIVQLKIVQRQPNDAGARMVAVFDCWARGVRFEGLGIWLHEPGFLSLGHPRKRQSKRHHCGAFILDPALEREMLVEAHATAAPLDHAFPPLVLTHRLQAAVSELDDNAAGLHKYLAASAR